MNIKSINIKDLKPAPYNPRLSTKKQEEKLSESLKKFGLVEPIIYNERTGYIVGGHFRVRELKKLGYKEVDCVIVDLSAEDEKELNIRLNANTGDWSWEDLANNWDSTKLEEWGLDIPHFVNEETEPELLDEPIKKPSIRINFQDVEQMQQAENDIKELIDRKYPDAICSVSMT